MKKNAAILLAFCLLLMTAGCGYKYTTVVNKNTYQSGIKSATILVFPVHRMDYRPPSSCLFPSDPSAGKIYEGKWNRDLKLHLITSYPGQKFIFIEADDPIFNEEDFTLNMIYALAEESALSKKIDASVKEDLNQGDPALNAKMAAILARFKEKFNADYALMFPQTSLAGEMQTTHTAGTYNPATGGMTGGGSSTVTYYTADIRVQIWNMTSGALELCSGAWEKSSGFCLFVSPQEMSVQNSVRGLLAILDQMLIAVLERFQAPVAVMEK